MSGLMTKGQSDKLTVNLGITANVLQNFGRTFVRICMARLLDICKRASILGMYKGNS